GAPHPSDAQGDDHSRSLFVPEHNRFVGLGGVGAKPLVADVFGNDMGEIWTFVNCRGITHRIYGVFQCIDTEMGKFGHYQAGGAGIPGTFNEKYIGGMMKNKMPNINPSMTEFKTFGAKDHGWAKHQEGNYHRGLVS